MAISGHLSEGAFMRYIRTTPEEHAAILSEYAEFNQSRMRKVE